MKSSKLCANAGKRAGIRVASVFIHASMRAAIANVVRIKYEADCHTAMEASVIHGQCPQHNAVTPER
jgi:hypothetical protein